MAGRLEPRPRPSTTARPSAPVDHFAVVILSLTRK
jgi:hypothetical protein